MIRILYVADHAQTLRDEALPLAAHAASLGWRVLAVAPGADDCPECRSGFEQALPIDWGRGPLGLLRAVRACRRIRDLVLNEEIDLVHSFSASAGFLARWALKDMRGLCYPRVIHTASTATPSALDRIAARWTDDLIVTDRMASSIHLRQGLVPAHHLHLVEYPLEGSDRGCDWAATERVYAASMGLSRTSSGFLRPASWGRATELARPRPSLSMSGESASWHS